MLLNSTRTTSENEDPELKAKVAEQSSKGTVKGNLLLKFFKCGINYSRILFIIFLFLLAQTLSSASDWFVQFW